jgi:thiol-disulfide isomerase/thioredoxin
MKNHSSLFAFLICLSFGVLSCSSDEETFDSTITQPALLVLNIQKALRNQEIIFSLQSADNEVYTDIATFYVNGNPITGNTFSAAAEGVFEISARYSLAGVETNTETQEIEVFIPKRKVLLEDFTGTWCGFCPRMTTLVKEAQTLTEHLAVVSIHGNSINTGVDPLTIEEGMFLKNYFEVVGYPTGLINRTEFWNQNNIAPQIEATAGEETNISIAINSKLIGQELSIDISIISENTIENKKLVLFLLEDGILEDQDSYYNEDSSSPWYQMGDPIPDFVHDHVLRMAISKPLGDTIMITKAFELYSKNIRLNIPIQFNSNQLSIVAIVVNGDETVNNAQFAHINQRKPFE